MPIEPSKQGFEQFVYAQPRGRSINHEDGWDMCAVGDYARSIDCRVSVVVDALEEQYGSWDHKKNNLLTVYDHLNLSVNVGETYGSLQDLLKGHKDHV